MIMPEIETKRLLIRPFVMADLEAAHQVLDAAVHAHPPDPDTDPQQVRAERESWLKWSVLNYSALARLAQPPYGDRAIVVKENGRLIGACGLVPSFGPFGLLPSWRYPGARPDRRNRPEVGLFYAIDPAHRRLGYASEAARALIDFAFSRLNLGRVVATTMHENVASQRVMEKVGMRLEQNPLPEPAWFQVVGLLDNP